jgi:hypothetical protein
MRAHDLHFRHDGNVGPAPRFDAEFHRGAQPGESRPQDQDIMSYLLHVSCAPSNFQSPAWKQKRSDKRSGQERFPHLQAPAVSAELGSCAIVAPTCLVVERHKVGCIS